MVGRRNVARGRKRLKRGGPRPKRQRRLSPRREEEPKAPEVIPKLQEKKESVDYASEEDEEEEEQQRPMDQLMALFGKRDQERVIDSDDSEEESEDQEEEEGEEAAVVDESKEETEEEVENLADDEDNDDPENPEADDEEDPFYLHWERQLPIDVKENLLDKKGWTQKHMEWKHLDRLTARVPAINTEVLQKQNPSMLLKLEGEGDEYIKAEELGSIPSPPKEGEDWHKKAGLKPQLIPSLKEANGQSELNGSQKELLTLLCGYMDVYYPSQKLDCSDNLQVVYATHLLNHVIKARQRVKRHDQKKNQKRDQGLVRPRVLVLLPFRSSALRLVRILQTLLFPEGAKANIGGLKRFEDDYGGESLAFSRKRPKPQDYQSTFQGNIDDDFRLGISISRKSLRLYADFYSSDVIVASPLGLRRVVGAPGEKERDWDFLASVEMLVLDQAEILLMQNWDHMLLLLHHLHMQPKEQHGVDFSRVRLWALDGFSKFYRQTVVLSSTNCPELQAVFSRHCANYAGFFHVTNPVTTGSICEISLQLPQMFLRFDVSSMEEASQSRLQFFKHKVLPDLQKKERNQVLLVVGSYLDFVRVRNVLRESEVRFLQASEYTRQGRLARTRNIFYKTHRTQVFLLYSERCHFFRRLRIKGVANVVFYQLPQLPHLYPQICELLHPSLQNTRSAQVSSPSCTAIFCRYDFLRLAAVVGSEKASRMLSSEASSHLLVSGEDS